MQKLKNDCSSASAISRPNQTTLQGFNYLMDGITHFEMECIKHQGFDRVQVLKDLHERKSNKKTEVTRKGVLSRLCGFLFKRGF